MRAFIGIALPEEVRALLRELQRRLQEPGADVKWVEPENLHVTVKFLGEITDAQRHTIDAWLARIGEATTPFPITVGGVGAFPSLQAPRIIWVGMQEGSERLLQVVERIEAEAAASLPPQEARRFAAHVTLGRVRTGRGGEAFGRALRELKDSPPLRWHADRLTLYQSTLTSEGPRYLVLAEARFAGAAAMGGGP